MKLYSQIITLTLTIIFLTAFNQKEEVSIWYPKELRIVQSCDGQEVEILVDIVSESEEEIKLHSFFLDKTKFTIIKDNKVFTETDTLILTKNYPIQLKIKYTIIDSSKPTAFSFMTNKEKYLKNHIILAYGHYTFTTEEIRKGKEQIINITESCQDSINVLFPYGGSFSSVKFYSDSSQTKEIFKSISYKIDEDANSISFSKSDVGRYYVDFSSCHWGNEFWMTIK